MLLYFSPAFAPIQIIPNLDPIILGPTAKPIVPHIFTFDNYLFKRCFLFVILVIAHFGFEGGTLVLIASLLTFYWADLRDYGFHTNTSFYASAPGYRLMPLGRYLKLFSLFSVTVTCRKLIDRSCDIIGELHWLVLST